MVQLDNLSTQKKDGSFFFFAFVYILGNRSCCILQRMVDRNSYRRFLSVNSRARQKRFRHKGLLVYEFGDVERRPKPELCSETFVRECLSTTKCLTKECVPCVSNSTWLDYRQRGLNAPVSPPETNHFWGTSTHHYSPMQVVWVQLTPLQLQHPRSNAWYVIVL